MASHKDASLALFFSISCYMTYRRVLLSTHFCMQTICLKGTSLQTLLVESGEMPLDLRRKMLAQKFRILVKNEESQPLSHSVEDCWQYHYALSNSKRPPFGQRTSPVEGIDPGPIEKTPRVSPFPPWHLHTPSVSLDLSNLISKNDHKEAWKSFISNGVLLCILIQTALKSLTPVERQQRFIYRASEKQKQKDFRTISLFIEQNLPPLFYFYPGLINTVFRFKTAWSFLALSKTQIEMA